MIERSDSQQTSCNAMTTVDGTRRQVATAVCSIRPGKGMNINVELMPDQAELTEQEKAEIAAMFAEYIAGEIVKAARLGIPVALPAQ